MTAESERLRDLLAAIESARTDVKYAREQLGKPGGVERAMDALERAEEALSEFDPVPPVKESPCTPT